MAGISRRSFLKGSGAVVAGAGIASLGLGCSAQNTSAQNDDAVDELDTGEVTYAISETVERDVVVVGGGASGIMAAYIAAEGGLQVSLLEASNSLGGCGVMSGGMMGCETTMQKEAGFDVSVNAMFAEWSEWNHDFSYAPLVRTIFSTSAEMIDWLTAHDVILELQTESKQASHADKPILWQGYHRYPNHDGAVVFDSLVSGLENTGCDIVYGARMIDIVQDGGAVTGIVYETGDNTYTQVNAKKVILATGGFAGNEEMVEDIFGTKYILAYPAIDQGEGTVAAWKAGARKWNLNSALFHGANAMAALTAPNHTLANLSVIGLLEVDATGRRFVAETISGSSCLWANAAFAVGGNPYIIIDQSVVDDFTNNTMDLALLNTDTLQLADDLSGIQDDLDASIAEGTVWKGETLDELAEAVGFDAEVFKKQIEDYNGYVVSGNDEQFGKDPAYLRYQVSQGPFYALVCNVGSLGTAGGLFSNPKMQPLTDNMQTIENLYCVGTMASGAFYGSLPGYPDYEGAALCFAFTSGYIAGNEMLKSLK